MCTHLCIGLYCLRRCALLACCLNRVPAVQRSQHAQRGLPARASCTGDKTCCPCCARCAAERVLAVADDMVRMADMKDELEEVNKRIDRYEANKASGSGGIGEHAARPAAVPTAAAIVASNS